MKRNIEQCSLMLVSVDDIDAVNAAIASDVQAADAAECWDLHAGTVVAEHDNGADFWIQIEGRLVRWRNNRREWGVVG
jgi:hypothetical protein